MTPRRIFVALTLSLMTHQVMAGTLEGVNLRDEVTLHGENLVLNGMGLRTTAFSFIRVKVYVGGLYLEDKSSDARSIMASSQTKHIVLKFVRSVNAARLRRTTEQSFRNYGGYAALKGRVTLLCSHLPNVSLGDEIRFTISGGKVHIVVKGNDSFTIEGEDFCDAVLGIYLGARPIDAGLKRGMLGLR